MWFKNFSVHFEPNLKSNTPQGDVCTKIITAGVVKHQKTTKERENMPLEIWLQVEMRNTVEKTWETEMRIGRRTKWGLGGGLKWPATQHWLKCGNSVLVSGIANGRRNSIRILLAFSIAKWPCWKASKKNFPLFGVLKPQPTSSSKWVGEPD